MTKTLISFPSSFASLLPPFPCHGWPGAPLCRPRQPDTMVGLFHGIPPPHSLDSFVDVSRIVSIVEGLLDTLADAALAADPSSAGAVATTLAQKNGGWFGFISNTMEIVLKVLKDGLTVVHVPYAYGFVIILLTVIVKVATFPLTKQQVEATLQC